MRLRNLRVLAVLAGLLAVMVGLVAYAPTLYRMFCAVTGYGGTVQRAERPLAPAAAAGTSITVSFDANVAPGLDWDFRPEHRKVVTTFGAPTKIYYQARNRTDQTVVGRATFNVTPYKAAPYFFKIECFCFTEERLGPHQSARMPVLLYIDEQMLKDPDTADIRDVTLSYTFFEQSDLSPEEVQAARDLSAGSQELDTKLDNTGATGFDNDAPRR